MTQLNTTEAAKLLHMSGYEVSQLIDNGTLSATKVGFRRMIEADELEAYAQGRAGVRDAGDFLHRIEELEAEVAELSRVIGSPSDPASRQRTLAIRSSYELEYGQRKRGKVSKRVRWLIFERDGHRCVYCGAEPGDGVKLTIDHRIPAIDGGTDEPDNLATACWDCNQGKKDRPLL